MLQAILRGKLSREQQNMEDILTSNVFGLLQYAPSREGLLPFLAQAESVDGSLPLSWLNDESLNVSVEPDDYEFWPTLNEPECRACEPDVLIRLRCTDRRHLLILIEAKYRSGKSSEGSTAAEHPDDQLACEWDNLVRVAQREGADPCLIYLTAHIGIPVSDIESSVAEYREKRPNDVRHPTILALSWHELCGLFRDANERMLRDLCNLCERMGLTYFHGVCVPATHESSRWQFDPLPSRWTRLTETPSTSWGFTK